MVKKKPLENNDLTRIEDLSEFTHQEDSELDSMFENLSPVESTENFELPEITGLHSSKDLEAVSAEEEPSVLEEVSFDELPDTDLGYNENSEVEYSENLEELAEVSFGESESTEEAVEELESILEDPSEEYSIPENAPFEEIAERPSSTYQRSHEATYYDEPEDAEQPLSTYENTSEKFEDVKTFAQNFSYGKSSLKGGNPPYTIIARNIVYEEDADDLINLLTEFGLVNDQNLKDTQKAMEFGSLIVPQISEYTAIVLAHKMRRYDLDLEVGLSDEVHPSRSGEVNPKGLLKKENLKQNRSESLKLSDLKINIKDIIISTTAAVPGYFVEEYLGVQTVYSIVEEAELEKLQFIEKTKRDHTELYDYNSSELTTEKAFQDYQNSFALLYDDLALQLKQKAFAQKANALLGLSFQLSPLQFERSHTRINAYQITCSATLAVIGKEKS